LFLALVNVGKAQVKQISVSAILWKNPTIKFCLDDNTQLNGLLTRVADCNVVSYLSLELRPRIEEAGLRISRPFSTDNCLAIFLDVDMFN
jgi:hypothetical protein